MNNQQEAMYRCGYNHGHSQLEPLENPVEAHWYRRGYDAGFKASIGITLRVEREGETRDWGELHR